MNEIKIDRDVKVLLLKVLKQGYFTQNDMDVLRDKIDLNIKTANIVLTLLPSDIPLATCEEEIQP
jgi:hypothetical protein